MRQIAVDGAEVGVYGGQGRNRTADTGIFNPYSVCKTLNIKVLIIVACCW